MDSESSDTGVREGTEGEEEGKQGMIQHMTRNLKIQNKKDFSN